MSARAMGIASKEYHEEVGFDEASINPVGTGPYRAVSFTPDERIELERFEDYWGAPAELDRVEMVHVPEVASRVTGIVNGEFDLATNIPPDQASALDVEGVETMGVTWPMFHVYVIAMNTAPTDDPRVRRAMRLCTDREALVEGLWDGKAGVPTAHQFPEHPLYDASLNFIEHDPGRRARCWKRPATRAKRSSPSSRGATTSTAISPRRSCSSSGRTAGST